jgi:aspartate aminotransferase-like enzyme
VEKGTFFFPGPTEIRREVLDAMLRQPLPGRTPVFRELFASLQQGLKPVFRTERTVYVATSSGSGMMEAAVRCAPPGKILSIVGGAFAERFVRIARACGREVQQHDVAYGDVADPAEVRALLAGDSYAAITIVHSETSTGALSDVQAVAQVAREAGVAIIVDSVSGVGGAQFETDAWDVDCVVSASQKAIAVPPGLAFAVVSEKYLRNSDVEPGRGLYLDLAEFDVHARNNETTATPSTSLMFALAYQLSDIAREGMEARWARHEAMRETMEEWVVGMRESLGLDIGILARAGARSPTVTVVTVPERIGATRVVKKMAARGYTIGNGYGPLRGTTFRVGHMGDHTVAELERCLAAVAESLEELA